MDYWTLDRLKKEAKKFNRRIDFQKQSRGAYVVALKKDLLNQICKHMNTKNVKNKGFWTIAKIKKEAKKYTKRVDFQKKAGGAYKAAKTKGILDEALKHIKKKQVDRGYWTFNAILSEAIKHKTKENFRRNANTAYQAACRKNMLKEIYQYLD